MARKATVEEYHVVALVAPKSGKPEPFLRVVDWPGTDHEDVLYYARDLMENRGKNKVKILKVGRGNYRPGLYPELHIE